MNQIKLLNNEKWQFICKKLDLSLLQINNRYRKVALLDVGMFRMLSLRKVKRSCMRRNWMIVENSNSGAQSSNMNQLSLIWSLLIPISLIIIIIFPFLSTVVWCLSWSSSKFAFPEMIYALLVISYKYNFLSWKCVVMSQGMKTSICRIFIFIL